MTLLLRTLTRKSYLKFGKYADIRVGNLLDLGISEREYLLWSYYSCSMINFNDDVLAELGITEEFRIEKPGKDKRKLYDFKHKNYSEIDFIYKTIF